MDFDRTRYVAPGVPRIVEYKLGQPRFIDLRKRALQIVNVENRPYFDQILNRRRENVKINAQKIDLSNIGDIKSKGVREYCIEGAIAQNALCYVGFRGASLSGISGLPLLTNELANDYGLIYQDHQKSEGERDIRHLVEKGDPSLVRRTEGKAQKLVKILVCEGRLFTSPQEVGEFLVKMGIEGVKMTYVRLVEQNLMNCRI